MSERPEVVVVDGLRETTEVLRAVLEPRGVRVSRQTSTATLVAADLDRPQVLVLHEDPPADPDGPRVLIGRIAPGSNSATAHCRALPLPFDYGDLLAAVNAAVQTPAR